MTKMGITNMQLPSKAGIPESHKVAWCIRTGGTEVHSIFTLSDDTAEQSREVRS